MEKFYFSIRMYLVEAFLEASSYWGVDRVAGVAVRLVVDLMSKYNKRFTLKSFCTFCWQTKRTRYDNFNSLFYLVGDLEVRRAELLAVDPAAFLLVELQVVDPVEHQEEPLVALLVDSLVMTWVGSIENKEIYY